MLININIFIFIVFLLIKNISSSNETVLFVFQMNRNGARAPNSGVNNGKDIYFEKWISNGELSNVGKRQQYLLGVKARKKYIEKYNLLSESYNPQEIYIKSTDNNRTIESIYSFIQGLYSNGTGQKINENVVSNTNITYPPNKNFDTKFEYILQNFLINNDTSALPYNMTILPIHIFYDPDHHFQLYDIKNCPGIKNISEKQKNREEIKEFSNRLKNGSKDFFKELEKKFTNESKVEDNFLENYTTLYRYMDSFVCDEKDQRDFSYLNIFTDYSLNLDNLHNISTDFVKDDYKANINSKNISIVDTSYTLRSILNWMDKAIEKYNNSINISNGFNDTQNYIKYVFFSSQGSSIGTLDSFMHYFFNISIDDIDFFESRYFE